MEKNWKWKQKMCPRVLDDFFDLWKEIDDIDIDIEYMVFHVSSNL